MRFTLIELQVCHGRWTRGRKRWSGNDDRAHGPLGYASRNAFCKPVTFSLSLLLTQLRKHRIVVRNIILGYIFAYVECAADLLRIHNLDACLPSYHAVCQLDADNTMPNNLFNACQCQCPNAMPSLRTPKDLLGILHKRYAISQIDCLFHCLIPISFTNLFILISSASPSLSAYLSDRPLVSTRMYSIS